MKSYKTIIIDGYNLIHKMDNLRQHLSNNLEYARDQLINSLAAFRTIQKRSSKIRIIFDGFHAPDSIQKSHFAQNGIDIMFSNPGEEADEVIKRLVSRNHNPNDWLVVSSDRRDITDVLHKNQVATISSEEFLKLLNPHYSNLNHKQVDHEVNNLLRVKQLKSEVVIKLENGWVAIAGGKNITAIYLTVTGNFSIQIDSQPEGMKINHSGAKITLINAENSLLSHDILFEFEGKLQLLNCQIINENGDTKDAKIQNG